ncbi:MAG: hypothetical protein B6243_05140 [Anaerolineaceae bacterium 4572_5.2]|nr:MAG: hypothetical protein B6243_05140 [Anaerolineaceae bacterium 4572_5.2]
MQPIRVTLQEGMHFLGELDGFGIHIDADESVGGKNKGPRPKGLSLISLAGCTAMDVISILRKMKVEPEEFYVDVAAVELTDQHPKVFKKILLKYYLKGTDVPRKKVEKAVELSQTRYCGVTAMLEHSAEIDYEIVIEEV